MNVESVVLSPRSFPFALGYYYFKFFLNILLFFIKIFYLNMLKLFIQFYDYILFKFTEETKLGETFL